MPAKGKYKIKRKFVGLDNNYVRKFCYELYLYEEYLSTFRDIKNLQIYLQEYERANIITGDTPTELIKNMRALDD